MIPWNDVRAELESDAELRYAVRSWTASLRLSVGDRHHCLRFVDGSLVTLEACAADAPCDVFVAGPQSEWRELLRQEPRPFYQDLAFACAHHGLEMSPDRLDYAAYYPALRRLVEVLRGAVNRHEPSGAA